MAELERDLHALRIELPPEPDLAPRVRAALGPPPRRRHSRLVLVAAALAVALGAALAVPDSRSALLRFFGIQGATVVELGDLPKVGPARWPSASATPSPGHSACSASARCSRTSAARTPSTSTAGSAT
jgi:hypothetical protein